MIRAFGVRELINVCGPGIVTHLVLPTKLRVVSAMALMALLRVKFLPAVLAAVPMVIYLAGAGAGAGKAGVCVGSVVDNDVALGSIYAGVRGFAFIMDVGKISTRPR